MVWTVIGEKINSLVLYSKPENVWKITDFGYSTEGTSTRLLTSEYSRGTASYRAPELVKEKHTFNNKVDIWAIGCILYELAFQKKAFETDMAVLLYALSDHRLKLPSQVDNSLSSGHVDAEYRALLERFVDGMLDSNPSNRPTARELRASFGAASGHWPQTPAEGSALRTRSPPEMRSAKIDRPTRSSNRNKAQLVTYQLAESSMPHESRSTHSL